MSRKFKICKKNITKYIYCSADGQVVDDNCREDRIIFIGKEAVPVSEEIYKEYYKMDRHARYLEKDVKVGRSKLDPITGSIEYTPSKEDSVERLYEIGMDFKDEQSVEDIVCDNAMLLILNKAKEALDEEELKLINSIYEEELTYRQVGEIFNISHVAIQKRHNKILDKLRKFFS